MAHNDYTAKYPPRDLHNASAYCHKEHCALTKTTVFHLASKAGNIVDDCMNKMNYLTSTSRKVEIVSLLAVTGEVACVIVTSNGFVRRTTASECTIVTLVNICTQTQVTPSVPLSHSSISARRHKSRRVYHCHTRQYLHTDTIHAECTIVTLVNICTQTQFTHQITTHTHARTHAPTFSLTVD